jgi:hypothetical protein
MKVMLLMWSDGSYSGAGTAEDYAAWGDYESGLRADGVYVAAGQFHEGAAGRVVPTALASPDHGAARPPEPGDTVLSGYYLLECASLDDAVEYGRRAPLYGSVEVRQLVEF